MDSAADVDALVTWWRPLDDDEKRTGVRKLRAVHRTIRMRFTELDRDLVAEVVAAETGNQAEKDWRDTLIDLECEVVKRAMLNPDMLKSESIDDYTFLRDTTRIDGKARLAERARPPAVEFDRVRRQDGLAVRQQRRGQQRSESQPRGSRPEPRERRRAGQVVGQAVPGTVVPGSLQARSLAGPVLDPVQLLSHLTGPGRGVERAT